MESKKIIAKFTAEFLIPYILFFICFWVRRNELDLISFIQPLLALISCYLIGWYIRKGSNNKEK